MTSNERRVGAAPCELTVRHRSQGAHSLSDSLSLYLFAAEVMLLDSVILVYKVINDIIVYVVGNAAENELILQSVLQALDETVANLLKYEHAARREEDGRGWGGWRCGWHGHADADADMRAARLVFLCCGCCCFCVDPVACIDP